MASPLVAALMNDPNNMRKYGIAPIGGAMLGTGQPTLAAPMLLAALQGGAVEQREPDGDIRTDLPNAKANFLNAEDNEDAATWRYPIDDGQERAPASYSKGWNWRRAGDDQLMHILRAAAINGLHGR
jgi:hypothetical protein